MAPKRGLALPNADEGVEPSIPCGISGECLAKGLAVPEVPMENRLDPMPEDAGTFRSDPRLKTLFGLLLAA